MKKIDQIRERIKKAVGSRQKAVGRKIRRLHGKGMCHDENGTKRISAEAAAYCLLPTVLRPPTPRLNLMGSRLRGLRTASSSKPGTTLIL
jgi:hypothetical protein